MRRQGWWLPLMALVFITNWNPTLTLPVPGEELDESTKLLGSSVVTSVSIVTGAPDHASDDNGSKTSTIDRRRVISSTDLPGSPANLMRPDKFQFFTLNKEGNVVTKQMTEQEIHSLIAAGGGHLPMEIHEPQQAGDAPSGGMKVADVVQNVQNVLKGELNKPATVMTSVPTIPGHVNTEWSSILPAILGGDSETGPVSDSSPPSSSDEETPSPVDATTVKIPDAAGTPSTTIKLPAKEPAPSLIVDYDNVKKPTGTMEPEEQTEKPMIEVPVITVEQKLPSHQYEDSSTPVFQMLNTLSADKVNGKNKTHFNGKPQPAESSSSTLENAGTSEKPEKLPVEQNVVAAPIAEQPTVFDDKLPEIIEINYSPGNVEPSVITHAIKPLQKPEAAVISSEIISESPEPQPPAMTVISETHSTSMKVSGHDEIPFREPSKPLVETTERVAVESGKPEGVTEKSPVVSTDDSELDLMPLKVQVSTEKPTEISTESLISQGISFFGNLPQTVNSIVSDLINNNAQTPRPIGEPADINVPSKSSEELKEPAPTSDAVKIPEPTKSSIVPTTIAPTKETVTPIETVANAEPVFEIMPEIIPDKKKPSPETLPSEVSSIEHIIGTLNDPTGSISGTVAADHFVTHKLPENPLNLSAVDAVHVDPPKITQHPMVATSTSATPFNVETPATPSAAKPMEPLPTELADSLTSMISQISDAMPSVLPLGQSAGLDTTEKKTSLNVNAEDPGAGDEIASEQPEAAVKIELPVENESSEPGTVPAKPVDAPAVSSITTPAEVQESNEKLEGTTELPTSTVLITTQSPSLDSSTTLESAVSSADDQLAELPVTKTESPISIIDQKNDGVSAETPEKLRPHTDNLEADSEIAIEKVQPQAVLQEAEKVEAVTEGSVAGPTSTEGLSTVTPLTIETSSAKPIASTVESDHTEPPAKVQTDGTPTAQEFPKLDGQDAGAPIKIKLNKNDTELPIVHLDIKGAKPIKFHKVNESTPIKIVDNGEESPLVRIKLTDPISLINSMIESSTTDIDPPPVEHLSLPKPGSVPPNTIASSLIAGPPSSTNPTTTVATLDQTHDVNDTDSAQSPPDVILLNDAPANNVTADIKSDVEKNELQGGIATKLEGQEKDNPVTEKTEIAETLTSEVLPPVAPETAGNRIELPNGAVHVDGPETSATVHAPLAFEESTDKPKKSEPFVEITTSKSVEASTTLATTVAIGEKTNAATTMVDNVTSPAEEPTTPVNAPLTNESTENPIKILTSSTPELVTSSDKLGTSSKPNITLEQPESTTMKVNDPGVFAQSINATKTEDDPKETVFQKIQSTNDLPGASAAETSESPKEPAKNQAVQTPNRTEVPQSVIAVQQSSIELSENHTEPSSNIASQATTVSTVEGSASDPDGEKIKVAGDTKEKTGAVAESTLPEAVAELSSTISAPPKTEEIRIQVNETAVLVTKRPVSELPSQKLSSTTKSPEKQATEEQPTTPKVTLIPEDPYSKLGEKIHGPVVLEINGLSSSHEDPPPGAPSKKVIANASETDTRIHLGEEQSGKIEAQKIAVNDTRKPIKKNSDSSPMEEKIVPLALTTTTPQSHTSEKPVADQEKDSASQLSTKVEVTAGGSSNDLSNTSHVSQSNEVHHKPSELPEPALSSKVTTGGPIHKPGKPVHKPTMNIKKDDAPLKPTDDQWTLIPQQVHPASAKPAETLEEQPITTEVPTTSVPQNEAKVPSTEKPPVSLDHPQSASGLDSTVKNLETDVFYFVNLCNELAFTFWTATNKGLSSARSLAVSPFGMTSLLAMVFLGARGPTSDQMNDILKLDDVASFNPHLVFQNVTDAVGLARNQGVANAAFVRVLFADRLKVRKLMPYYKDQAQQFYDGIVAEVNFATISDLVRRRTNLMIRKQTGGRIKDFVRTNTLPLRSPLAALSANVFQTDCNSSAASSEGRDGELYFAVSPAVRQRKLVPIPATVWRAGVLAGYEPSLDATAIALGGTDKLVSTIFVIPGQQGLTAPGDTLDRLEQRIVRGATYDASWNKMLKVLIPRPGLELQVPKFSHRSVINATAALKRMGLEELFSKHADLKGINGYSSNLHLADVLQMNLFSTCGDENIISGRHHVEVYPASPVRNSREYSEPEEGKDEPFEDYSASEENGFRGSAIPYPLRRETRSARQNDATEKQRLKLDRPFLYFVRHNPTGLILHMGRFNPRLLP